MSVAFAADDDGADAAAPADDDGADAAAPADDDGADAAAPADDDGGVSVAFGAKEAAEVVIVSLSLPFTGRF